MALSREITKRNWLISNEIPAWNKRNHRNIEIPLSDISTRITHKRNSITERTDACGWRVAACLKWAATLSQQEKNNSSVAQQS